MRAATSHSKNKLTYCKLTYLQKDTCCKVTADSAVSPKPSLVSLGPLDLPRYSLRLVVVVVVPYSLRLAIRKYAWDFQMAPGNREYFHFRRSGRVFHAFRHGQLCSSRVPCTGCQSVLICAAIISLRSSTGYCTIVFSIQSNTAPTFRGMELAPPAGVLVAQSVFNLANIPKRQQLKT